MDRITSDPRRLSVEEIQELRRDMQESSAWTKDVDEQQKFKKILRMISMMVLRKVTFLTSCYISLFYSH